MTRVRRTGLWRYGGAVVVVVLATGARLLLAPLLSEDTPFLTYFPAIALVAWACGSGPTLVSVILASGLAAYFFLLPHYSFTVHRQSDQIALGIFVAFGLITAALSEQVRKARRRTEQKQQQLEEERQRWQTTLASVGDAVLVTDERGIVTFLNGVAQALTGWPQNEAFGRPLGEVFHIVSERDRRPAENPVARVIQSGRIQGLANHTVLIARDGSERSIADSAAPIRRAEGDLLGVVLVFRDVTQERRASRALEESEARFTAFVNNAPAAIFIKDASGKHLLVNTVFERLAGIARDRLLGLSDDEIYPPNLADRFRQTDRRILASGQAETFEEPFEHGGQAFTFLTTKFPLLDAEGRPCAVCGIATDITGHKRAEEALAESEAVLRSFYDTTPLMMGVVDVLQDDILHLSDNSATGKFFGLRPDALRNRFASQQGVPQAHLQEWIQHYRESARTGLPVRFEYAHQTPERRNWLSATVCYIETTPEGRLRCSYIVEDVTERKRAEAEVERLNRTSEQQRRIYETALSNSADFNYVFDLRGRFVYVNKALLALWGKELHEAVGKNFFELAYPPDLAERLQRQIQEAVDARQPVKDETPYTSAVGERQYEYIFVPVLGADGAVEAVAGSTRDVTERKRAEDALREAERRWRNLAEALPNLVWTDLPDGQCDYLSSQWSAYTGIPVEEMLGLNWLDLVIHPDDRERTAALWREACADRADYDLEYRIRRHDGVYHWFKTRGVPIRDQQGRIVYWFGACTDIEDQKRAGEAFRFLADSSAALATLVDYESTLQKVANLAVPLFADWSAVDVARENGSLRRLAVAHLDPSKVQLAHDLASRYPPDPDAPGGIVHVFRSGQPEIVANITDDMLVQGARNEEHLRLIRALGLKSYICVPLVVSGKAFGVLTFATAESGRNYTPSDLALAEDLAHRAAIAIENSQLYRALKDADQRKDEFLATLAHELRNPLAPIRNALQVMRLADNNEEAVEQSRSMMERQVVQMVRLVDDLLDVSRITRNKLELRRERIELATVVGSAVETSRPLIDQMGHHLTVKLPTAPVYLDADPTRLAQVFSNLLNNSAKYTEKGGRIQLTAERQGGEVVVRVRDNGVGIPGEALPRLFEMFSQVDRNLERAQGGLGIGLTLVRRLVEMHGGKVEAHSEGVGRGSEFVVRLPVMEEDARREEPQAQGDSEKTVAPNRRILVVDDNRDGAESLSMLLSLMGNETRTARDGLEAVEAAAAFRPDVILLDIGLPKLNGYDACRQIRAQPAGKGIVIIACTGWGQEEDRRRSNEAGFDHHMVKPVDPAALEELLAGLESPS